MYREKKNKIPIIYYVSAHRHVSSRIAQLSFNYHSGMLQTSCKLQADHQSEANAVRENAFFAFSCLFSFSQTTSRAVSSEHFVLPTRAYRVTATFRWPP